LASPKTSFAFSLSSQDLASPLSPSHLGPLKISRFAADCVDGITCLHAFWLVSNADRYWRAQTGE
jgi:hypothetical protein